MDFFIRLEMRKRIYINVLSGCMLTFLLISIYRTYYIHPFKLSIKVFLNHGYLSTKYLSPAISGNSIIEVNSLQLRPFSSVPSTWFYRGQAIFQNTSLCDRLMNNTTAERSFDTTLGAIVII